MSKVRLLNVKQAFTSYQFSFNYVPYYFSRQNSSQISTKENDLRKSHLPDKPTSSKIHDYRVNFKNQCVLAQNFVETRDTATESEWLKFLKTLLDNKTSTLNNSNIDSFVMDKCYQSKNFNLAKCYITFIKSRGRKLNELIVITFLNLCYDCRSHLAENDLKIVQYFTDRLSKCEVQNESLKLSILKGLSIVNDWEKAVEEHKIIETLHPSVNAFSVIITCLIENNQTDLAYELMTNSQQYDFALPNTVYIAWLDKIQANPSLLNDLLLFFNKHNVIPEKSTCVKLVDVSSKLSAEHEYNGIFTWTNLIGKCHNCGNLMKKNLITDEEFNHLRKEFLERVLIGHDVFTKSTLKEMENFLKFIKVNGPFDIVIDSLNILYVNLWKTKQYNIKLLLTIVNKEFNKGKKICVIGKKHLQTLPAPILESIMEKTHFFLTDNTSRDDLFIIYASLHSGKKCMFLTGDLFRKEKFKLNDHYLGNLFKKWQTSHQLYLKSNLEVIEKPPLFEVRCQLINGIWHVPYYEDDSKSENYRDLRKYWLCLKR